MTVHHERISSWEELRLDTGSKPVVVAGGTDLVPLMRAGIVRPHRILDIGALDMRQIAVTPGETLSLGALVTMADAAAHPSVRALAPAISQALWESASPQVRNMATLGGNLMQRTRCCFFRDPFSACNKREPGAGCPANESGNRYHAIFGGSSHCRAVHASDLATALSALDASIRIGERGANGRDVSIDAFYTAPNVSPDQETVLQPGELITEIQIPLDDNAWQSAFAKVRDRASFEFAVVSAAVAVCMRSNEVQDIRIAVGGVAYKPWRLGTVERRLAGEVVDRTAVERALMDFGADADPLSENAYKVDLARELVLRTICRVVGVQ